MDHRGAAPTVGAGQILRQGLGGVPPDVQHVDGTVTTAVTVGGVGGRAGGGGEDQARQPGGRVDLAGGDAGGGSDVISNLSSSCLAYANTAVLVLPFLNFTAADGSASAASAAAAATPHTKVHDIKLIDQDTAVSASTFRAALRAAGSMLHAVEAVRREKQMKRRAATQFLDMHPGRTAKLGKALTLLKRVATKRAASARLALDLRRHGLGEEANARPRLLPEHLRVQRL